MADRAGAVRQIGRVLQDGLRGADGINPFAGRLVVLHRLGLTPEQVYDDTLALLFNAPGGGALQVENLRGVTGEVALRLGDHPPFGVINVGDDAKLVALCREHGFNTGERTFAGSLFHELDRPQSSVHVLIGSKKFTEGWNSWRVSTMGQMNVGRGEGAQIIQLFGRGVRLKGLGLGLKRSARATLPAGLARPEQIELLETLHVFGIRADYMEQFRAFLEDEGLPADAREVIFTAGAQEQAPTTIVTRHAKPVRRRHEELGRLRPERRGRDERTSGYGSGPLRARGGASSLSDFVRGRKPTQENRKGTQR